MKVVIDIPEETYKYLAKIADAGKEPLGYFERVIMRGTPLPKGHGRLIDADEVQFENTEFETYGDYCIAFDAIDDAPAIIEADKESEE